MLKKPKVCDLRVKEFDEVSKFFSHTNIENKGTS